MLITSVLAFLRTRKKRERGGERKDGCSFGVVSE